jgi:hypothetical protein
MHQDWLVVRGAPESLEDESFEDESLEDESLEDESLEDVSPDDVVLSDEDDDVLGVLVAAGDVVVLATVVVPIEPSNTITPHARTNADSVAAMTVRRIRATRRARSARRARPRAARSDGWGVGMRPS